ncbi:TPA: DNA helicase UvrD [Candidatus Woesearchaeota archaeon]|nr:DNA helicase UvrD [Candidatus Woesearchaeota archaeon]
MTIIADLHIHSKHSRGCSTALDIDNLERYARMKGMGLLGTGDFTHPKWIEELKAKLSDESGEGIYRTKTGFPFMLQTEISLIYSSKGKGRRVHNVVLAPSIETAEQITEELKKHGRVDYDGRPIFKIPCPDFVEMMRKVSADVEVIPAHIWTPHFSVMGDYNQFKNMDECFEDQTRHIHAVETGLSSDPPMNWRCSFLDKFNLVSFSDLHSFWPWRIGREATIFECELRYKDIIKAIRTGEGLTGTVEVDPAYGKYHYDGHRNCNVCMSPQESSAAGNRCPKCGSLVTIGVEHRVEELADRPEGYRPADAKKFYRLLPLSELLQHVFGKGIATKGIWDEYNKILRLGTEMEVLLERTPEELQGVTTTKMADAILRNREGKITVKPGFDGVYGQPLFSEEEREYEGEQRELGTGPMPKEREKTEKEGQKGPKTPKNKEKQLKDKAQKGLMDF